MTHLLVFEASSPVGSSLPIVFSSFSTFWRVIFHLRISWSLLGVCTGTVHGVNIAVVLEWLGGQMIELLVWLSSPNRDHHCISWLEETSVAAHFWTVAGCQGRSGDPMEALQSVPRDKNTLDHFQILLKCPCISGQSMWWDRPLRNQFSLVASPHYWWWFDKRLSKSLNPGTGTHRKQIISLSHNLPPQVRFIKQWQRGERNWFGHETRPWTFVWETRSNFHTLSGVSQSKEHADFISSTLSSISQCFLEPAQSKKGEASVAQECMIGGI